MSVERKPPVAGPKPTQAMSTSMEGRSMVSVVWGFCGHAAS